MNPDVIQFACNHCQSWLTVPAHLAGVAGPCPKCGQHIVSPHSSSPVPPPVHAPLPVAPPVNIGAPAGMPWNSGRPPTGGLGAPPPAPAAYPPPAADGGWGMPPIVPGAPLPVMPSVPMGNDPSQVRSQPPPAPPGAEFGTPWGSPQGLPPAQQPQMQPPPNGGYPQGQPSIAMQPTLLRPQPGQQGPAAAPPQMPPNAIADALRNLPPGMPGSLPTNLPLSNPLTRPEAIGGSRLSLLARQLTSMDGGQNLPHSHEQQGQPQPQPQPQRPITGPRDAYGRSTNSEQFKQPAMGPQMSFPQSTGDAAPHQPYRQKRKTGGGKLVATLVLLIVMGGGGYYFKDQLREVWERTMPPDPGLPETTETPTENSTPGVDSAPADVVAKANTQPPSDPSAAYQTSSSMTTSRTPAEPKVLTPEPVPPRAMPVTDQDLAATPPTGSAPDPAASKAPAPPPTPMGVQTTRAPDRGMVASSSSSDLVEVGRAKDDPTLVPKPDNAPLIGNSERPILRDVPPVCNVAVQGLKKFLAATNWKERMPYVQLADQMQRKAEIYYTSNQDGPVNVDEIRYLRHDEDPQVGKGMHVVFELASRAWNYRVPVMVEQINNEARVDWLTFVEFKDDLLNKFVANYMVGPVRFHVGIRRSHYFEDGFENDVPNVEQKDVFEITTPMENLNSFVFTPKGTPLARSLASTLSWDKDISWVVVELQWRKEGTAKWIELTALPQLNWYSDGSAPESVSAPSSPVAVPGAAAP